MNSFSVYNRITIVITCFKILKIKLQSKTASIQLLDNDKYSFADVYIQLVDSTS